MKPKTASVSQNRKGARREHLSPGPLRLCANFPSMAGAALMACASGAWAGEMEAMHDHHHGMHHPMAAPAVTAPSRDVRLYDLPLVDHRGQPVRLQSDLVRDRLVAINFIYTSCTAVCPLLSTVFEQMQAQLGERLGRDVLLISISIDPNVDTPARLQAYADRFHARPGWLFLTGDKGNVDQVLLGLGAYSASPADHAAMILVGDGAVGGWTRFYGFPAPEKLIARLDELGAQKRLTAAPAEKQP